MSDVTDDEIRELREDAWEEYEAACLALGYTPLRALSNERRGPDCKPLARARCAELIRARKEGERNG